VERIARNLSAPASVGLNASTVSRFNRTDVTVHCRFHKPRLRPPRLFAYLIDETASACPIDTTSPTASAGMLLIAGVRQPPPRWAN
jgi:hypothetical protein